MADGPIPPFHEPSVPGPDISEIRVLAPDDTIPDELVGDPELALIRAREVASLAIQAGGITVQNMYDRSELWTSSQISLREMFGYLTAVEVTENMVKAGIAQLEVTIERLRPEHMQLQALEGSQR